MNREVLRETVSQLRAKGKGILAMDESTSTMNKRLQDIGVDTTEQMRAAFRELVVTTPGLGTHICGAILYDETIRQKVNGKSVPEILRKAGIVPGIKVDKGAIDIPEYPGEKVTEGLDGLRDRLKEYRMLGAAFAKWRAIITIGKDIPTQYCIDANAHALARYAALCQEQGIVPIVEPEVLLDGTHTIEDSYAATDRMLHALFIELKKHRVYLEGLVLKPNFVRSGLQAAEKADVSRVAHDTYRCFRENVPAAVPVLALISGGQSDEDAANYLNAINKMFPTKPWRVTFSYSRSMLRSALQVWKGNRSNSAQAQKELLKRAEENSKASEGLL